jgi:hypothetical protein
MDIHALLQNWRQRLILKKEAYEAEIRKTCCSASWRAAKGSGQCSLGSAPEPATSIPLFCRVGIEFAGSLINPTLGLVVRACARIVSNQ